MCPVRIHGDTHHIWQHEAIKFDKGPISPIPKYLIEIMKDQHHHNIKVNIFTVVNATQRCSRERFYFSKCSHDKYSNLKERLKACHLYRQFKKYHSWIQLKYIEFFFPKGSVISFLHSNNLYTGSISIRQPPRLLDSALYCWKIKESRQATVAPDDRRYWSSWLEPSRLPVQEMTEQTQRQADGAHILYIVLPDTTSRLGLIKQQELSHRAAAHLSRSYISVSFSEAEFLNNSCSYTEQLEGEGEENYTLQHPGRQRNPTWCFPINYPGCSGIYP